MGAGESLRPGQDTWRHPGPPRWVLGAQGVGDREQTGRGEGRQAVAELCREARTGARAGARAVSPWRCSRGVVAEKGKAERHERGRKGMGEQ